ncbi:MAG: LysM peptidoglycan-binding domain-containing protein, partial [Burkholderiaceae bacterium]|nr:LysM peptidoglycan-binding domain-containing protein [Burkholderiaceae bacterium]
MTGRISRNLATLWAGIALATALASGSATARDPGAVLLGNALTGGTSEHVVQPGEHLGLIGARYGVSWRLLAQDNHLGETDRLRPGQVLVVEARHIVPQELPEGIVINVPQRMLFHFTGGALRAAYPVGLGRPSWPTPRGSFKVVAL